MKLLCLLLLASCAAVPGLKKVMGAQESAPTKAQVSNRDAWIGQSEEAIDLHPAFAIMSHETQTTESGIKIRKFKNTSGKEQKKECVARWGGSQANCDAIENETTCFHIFHLKSGKVVNYMRSGNDCTAEESEAMKPSTISAQNS